MEHTLDVRPTKYNKSETSLNNDCFYEYSKKIKINLKSVIVQAKHDLVKKYFNKFFSFQ